MSRLLIAFTYLCIQTYTYIYIYMSLRQNNEVCVIMYVSVCILGLF